MRTRFRFILLLILILIISPKSSSAYALLNTNTPGQNNLNLAIPDTYPGKCSPLNKVNDNAFALLSDFDKGNGPFEKPSELPYLSEENFEIVEFKDQLYVGMEADNSLGARLWRTRRGVLTPRNQFDWEEVSVDHNGKPFGVNDLSQVDHIDSLAVFKGHIFTSTGNRTNNSTGTLIFRSTTGNADSWKDSIAELGPGFGDTNNENFKDMVVFQEHLCGGTWNAVGGTEIWCTHDGASWTQMNEDGFGNSRNWITWSSQVFKGKLYFGVQNVGPDEKISNNDKGILIRTSSINDPSSWQVVYRGGPGSYSINILGEQDGYLIIAVPSSDGILIYRSISGNPNSWSLFNSPGMNNDPKNWSIMTDGATIYNNSLYVGITNPNVGFSIWRISKRKDQGSNELFWEDAALTPSTPDDLFPQLISHHGSLYIWTSNYRSGQQVLHTQCPICQNQTIAGPGTYSFTEVDTSFDLIKGELSSVEVCIYPGLHPPIMPGTDTLKQYFSIQTTPESADYLADITLSVNDDGLIDTETMMNWDIGLTQQVGSWWQPCPQDSIENNPDTGVITCTGIRNISSTWAITRHPKRLIFTTAMTSSLLVLISMVLLAYLINKNTPPTS